MCLLPEYPYLIAETAYNHEGDFGYLVRMVESVPDDVDAVKFHLLLNPDHYMRVDHPLYGSVKRWVFNVKKWKTIFSIVRNKNKDIIVLCDDPDSLEFVLSDCPEVKAVEIHSSGLSDYHLLRLGSMFGGILILGIGGSSEREIRKALEILEEFGKRKDILLMYGFQSYPTRYEDIGFYRMLYLKERLKRPMGYADHSPWNDDYGLIVSALPCGFGIPIIEKHFTLDKGKERIDWQSAVSPEDLSEIKKTMKIFWRCYAQGRIGMNESEVRYGRWGPNKKVPCYRRMMNPGEMVDKEDIVFLRVSEEISADEIASTFEVFFNLPERLNRMVEKGEVLRKKDFDL